jgi:hypothetical protein
MYATVMMMVSFPVWLARIWFAGGDPYHDMIDMIYKLYLEQEDL